MRNPVNSLRADLVRTVKATREAKAAELYAPEALRAALTKAAGDGFDHATIAGPESLDLRETDAAKAALIWLGEMKLDHTWEARGGASAGTHDLIVSWRPRAVV